MRVLTIVTKFTTRIGKIDTLTRPNKSNTHMHILTQTITHCTRVCTNIVALITVQTRIYIHVYMQVCTDVCTSVYTYTCALCAYTPAHMCNEKSKVIHAIGLLYEVKQANCPPKYANYGNDGWRRVGWWGLRANKKQVPSIRLSSFASKHLFGSIPIALDTSSTCMRLSQNSIQIAAFMSDDLGY